MGLLIGYYQKNGIHVLNKVSIERYCFRLSLVKQLTFVTLTKWVKRSLWILCPLMFGSVTFGPSLWNTFKLAPTDYHSAAIYLTISRFLWTAGFAWGLSVLTKFVIRGKPRQPPKTGKTNQFPFSVQ